MAYNPDILLGRISKTHGFDGTVTIKLEKAFIGKIPEMESVFLEIEGKPVPFFIENSDYPGADILRLKFLWYDTFEKAAGFTGCRVFLTTGKRKKPEAGIGILKGYKVFNSDSSFVGTVSSIVENPGNMLLAIAAPDGGELLLPFHENLIVSIDKRKKLIVMDLPEGLTDLD
ncbi:MAG: PRC-barrel domain-containing protein [Bacteroidales bacterium]|jgi:16S rRNA processing protein RimM|nr:PRC-barrel domain-containing protein [Bacteroidales bacterium]